MITLTLGYIYKLNKHIYIFLLAVVFATYSCKHKDVIEQTSTDVTDNFPEGIKEIMLNKCATSGCHNAQSYQGAGGLLLDSWEHLFDGGNNGAVVVPYDANNSSLLYFINTFEELGTTALPTMPYNQPPLSKDEYILLRDWINKGAPDQNGNIPFAENAATRQKIYMVQQGCDLVGVIDAERQVVMRYIPVGKTYGKEQPNNITISPDGKYAYVSFWSTNLIQKIDTRTDSVIAELQTPRGFQKAISLSADGKKLIACNWYTQDMLLIDAENMQLISNYGKNIQFIAGFESTPSSDAFYATGQFGNTIYKIAIDGTVTTISIDEQPQTQTSGAETPDPYSIRLSPNKSKYFITCTNTHEVRVLDASSDKLITTIPVGENPQNMSFSTSNPYLFVTCMNDTTSKLEVGSVYVLDYNKNVVVKKITGQFFQPYGISVDDTKGLVYIFSRNEDKNGPPPHHSSPCDGRNGFYQVYDINTLEPYTNKRFEVTVDPYGASVRFRQKLSL